MRALILILSYFLTVNIIGFAAMGIDKRKARKHSFRIPEATLFIIAVIGGCAGSIIGMYFFHHKTRKWKFVYGLPIILVIHILMLIVLISMPVEIIFL